MSLIPGIQVTSSALEAEKIRMDYIAQNIANAASTRDAKGNPYQAKIVSFETVMDKTQSKAGLGANTFVKVSGVKSDESLGHLVFNPQHPHANKDGMVRMSNVKVPVEMVNMIEASRAYEANLSAVNTSKQMVKQALAIGR